MGKKYFGNKVKKKVRDREDGLVLRQIEVLKGLSPLYPKVRRDCFKNRQWFDFELHEEKILVSIVYPNSRPSDMVTHKLGLLGWRILLVDYSDVDGSSLSKLLVDIAALPAPKNKHIIRMEKGAEPSAISLVMEELAKEGKLGF
jgi:hypothetical protein